MTSNQGEGEATARSVAAAVLVRVWGDDAFASAALDAELKASPQLDPRDVGLATELVYGVLRTEGTLEARVAELSARKHVLPDLAPRAHLLMGAYTLLFLDRIPPFAAVSEAVDGVRATADDRVAGFANAVLRKLATAVREHGRPSMAEAVLAGAPGWLRGSLRRSLGRAGAEAYLAAGPVPPPIGLCLALGEDREAWLATLREAAPGATIERGLVSPQAILVRGAGDVRRLPGAGGASIIQEEGAQAITLAAGARRGEQVLDACAGRGNKAWLLGQAVAPGGAVDAADLHPFKLEHLAASAPGRYVRASFAVDWTVGAGEVPGGYDRALVDAPCSGIGTLRRRPEIARRRLPEDPARLADLQLAIALRAAGRVRDGGRLLFAVCSVLDEEGEELAARLAAPSAEPGAPALAPAPFDAPFALALVGEASTLRLLPHVHGTDGYFIASFVVRRKVGIS